MHISCSLLNPLGAVAVDSLNASGDFASHLDWLWDL